MNTKTVGTKEAAGMVGVHPQTIRRAVTSGELHAVPFGSGPRSGWRIAVSELASFALRRADELAQKRREEKNG
jgi:excisionase family DNA binding protein